MRVWNGWWYGIANSSGSEISKFGARRIRSALLVLQNFRDAPANLNSEAWKPPPFQEKRSWSERLFSELSESSGVSRSSSRNSKFYSRNDISRLEQYENHNSRSNSRSDSRNR